jgi:hypothetical protein
MAAPDASTHDIRDYERRVTDANLPVPDPTRLTTQLVDRTISAFREVYDVRLAEMDKAIVLAAAQVNKVPQDDAVRHGQLRAEIDRQTTALREVILGQIENIRNVTAEKFEAVHIRIEERDIRVEQSAQENRLSLNAALAAAKEAVSEQNKANVQAIAKSEIAVQKQIDAMVQLMATSNKSLEDKIADLKSRLDRGEGRDTGSTESRTDRRLDVGSVLQALAVLAAIVGLIFVAFHKAG